MSEDPIPTISALRAELEALKRREAQFRANMVQEFLDRGERNTYLHTLREEQSALFRRQQEAFADLEYLTRKLEAEGEKVTFLELELGRIWNSWSWHLTAPMRMIGRVFGHRGARSLAPDVRGAEQVKSGIFTYYLHTSPFRVYRQSSFTLRGWAWPQDGRAITAVRVTLDGRPFMGRVGLEEPDVIAKHGDQAANPKPGFEVTFDTPPGRHALSLDAQIEGIEWRSVLTSSIWCIPADR